MLFAVVAGCSVLGISGTADFGDLQFSARDTVYGGTERGGIVLVHNTSSSAGNIGFAGICAVALQLYSDSAYRNLVWDQQNWFNTRAGGCKWGRQELEIPGGTTGTIATPGTPSSLILGDSLASGPYYVGVRIHLFSPADTTLVLKVGRRQFSP